ncbi:hypothetical protein [Pseudarthrobacter sp. WHRI 8279]|uniref:hypothetical protein n=1 Tax=Pseudarthrobacter sp. WHRI 8279 TaxID=3162566 RepID=UPI0032F09771
MWTKQSQGFCPACGRTTNHVTHFHKDDAGTLVASARCAECPPPEVAAEHHRCAPHWPSRGVPAV